MCNACQQERAYHVRGSWKKKKKKRAMWLEEREAAGKEYGGVSRRHFTEPSRFGMKLGT